MKIAAIVVRVLMGLIFLFASVSFFLKLFPVPEVQGAVKVFNQGVEASIYLMPLVKTVELLCGLALVSGFFVPLANIVLFPVTVNILLFHAFLAPEGVVIGILLFLGHLFLAYYYRDKYKPLFDVK